MAGLAQVLRETRLFTSYQLFLQPNPKSRGLQSARRYAGGRLPLVAQSFVRPSDFRHALRLGSAVFALRCAM